jgi:hypothetical protein
VFDVKPHGHETLTDEGRSDMLQVARIATRLPVRDLDRRGVLFEEVDIRGMATVDGIATIEGNYPSKGSGERGAWFRDCDGNLLGIGQLIPAAR